MYSNKYALHSLTAAFSVALLRALGEGVLARGRRLHDPDQEVEVGRRRGHPAGAIGRPDLKVKLPQGSALLGVSVSHPLETALHSLY